jgi:AcrR family transcriptional regulator
MEAPILTKGERTNRAILEAAYGLFIEQGYAATSMRQIAEKSGLALGGIYNHFASKERVFAAIVEERHPFFQIVPTGDRLEDTCGRAHTLVEELGHYPEFLEPDADRDRGIQSQPRRWFSPKCSHDDTHYPAANEFGGRTASIPPRC